MKTATAYLVKMMATIHGNDFNTVYDKNERIAIHIVNWIDQANNEEYDVRLEIVKASFPNFNY